LSCDKNSDSSGDLSKKISDRLIFSIMNTLVKSDQPIMSPLGAARHSSIVEMILLALIILLFN